VGQRGHGESRGLSFFSMEMKRKLSIGNGSFCTDRIVSAVKRVEFVSDRMSYIVLRGRWCNIFVLNGHAPSEEKSGDSKDSFMREIEQAFLYHFPKYHMEIELGDFNAKVGRECIFKPTIGNESLHKDSNENGGSKLCHIKKSSTMFHYRDIR